MDKRTFIVRSAKDQGVYQKGEVIRIVHANTDIPLETTKDLLAMSYEVRVSEFGKISRDLLPTRWSEENRLKKRIENLHLKAFQLLRNYREHEMTSWHSTNLCLSRKAMFQHYLENYTS